MHLDKKEESPSVRPIGGKCQMDGGRPIADSALLGETETTGTSEAERNILPLQKGGKE